MYSKWGMDMEIAFTSIAETFLHGGWICLSLQQGVGGAARAQRHLPGMVTTTRWTGCMNKVVAVGHGFVSRYSFLDVHWELFTRDTI